MVPQMFYYSLNDHLRKRFGEKLYRLSLDGTMQCPNRDGTLSFEGCAFCLEGSGAFAQKSCCDIGEQIELAKARVSKKTDAARFIAYFQSYTNTYAPIDKLREMFTAAIERPDIAVLSIATRPDCIGEEVLELLCELNRIKPVWVELGLQTANDKTAEQMNRCYKTSVYLDCAERLKNAKIEFITHVILGLPGETRADMEASVLLAAKSGASGIKLQLLHVLQGTKLADMYERGDFSCMSMEEYLDLVTDLIELLPEDMVIHRMTGDGAKSALIAPLWSADKKRVLNELRRIMIKKDTTQGRLWLPQNK